MSIPKGNTPGRGHGFQPWKKEIEYLVVYTLKGCATSMRAGTETNDYFCHAKNYDDAKEIYDDLIPHYGENLYHASLTKLVESTDYGSWCPGTTPTSGELNDDEIEL